MVICCLKAPATKEPESGLSKKGLARVVKFNKQKMATSIHPAFLKDDDDIDTEESKEEKMKATIRSNIIGHDLTFRGPYGRKRALFCDWSSHGRSLQFIEEFYAKEVLPVMSSWSSVSTVSSLQSTLYQDEACNIIRKACNASGDDKLIFTIAHSSSIYELLIKSLQLFAPLVFVGITDDLNHASWTKAGGEIITIPETSQGTLDTDHLRAQLELHHNGDRPLVGCFSACSRLSGVLQDDVKITEILHSFGALSFWDYTSVAAYANIDVNPQVVLKADSVNALFQKDALFFDCNKFIGGFSTPSILVVKAALVKHLDDGVGEMLAKPPLGLTVRAGLAIQLKESVGADFIMEQQRKVSHTVFERISKNPSVVLLGNTRLSCNGSVAFVIKNAETGLYLHHKFVSSLLNDLFGIQSSVGNAIDSSYSMYIFGSDCDDISVDTEVEKESCPGFLRGFTVVDLAWFLSDAEINYALDAILLIANEGWKLLPQYMLNTETGEWSHYSAATFADMRSLSSIGYDDQGQFTFEREPSCGGRAAFNFDDSILKAKEAFRSAKKVAQTCQIIDMSHLISEKNQAKRWFLLPSEAKDVMSKKGQSGRPVCADRLAIRIYGMASSEDPGKVGTLTGRGDYSHLDVPNVTIQGKGLWLKNATAKMKKHDEEEPKLAESPHPKEEEEEDEAKEDAEDANDGGRSEPNAEINANAGSSSAMTKPYWISRFWTRSRNKTQPLQEESSKIESSADSKEEERHSTTESNNGDKLASVIEETETDTTIHGCNGKLPEIT